MRQSMLSLLMVLLAACGVAGADEIYVSPTGTPQGDGTRAKPLDIFTALGKASPAQPGDTILLLGGTYEGRMKGIQRVPFELAVSGSAEKPIIVRPVPGQSAHLNGAASVTSSFTHYIGLDIGDLLWDRFREKHRVPTAVNVTAGRGAKFINCNIFGGSMGSGVWRGAVDFEMYGCLIHDFGSMSRKGGRGHGHAVYTQNSTGTKRYEHNVFYRGCGWNFDIYTQGGQIVGFDVIENISYAAGWYKPGQVSFSYGVSGWQPADRIRFVGNLAYQPRDAQKWRGNFRLIVHRKPDVTHKKALVKDNVVMGAFRGLGFGLWEDLTVTGNTVWSTGILTEIAVAPGGTGFRAPDAPKPPLDHYHVDHNTYYANGVAKPFRYGGGVESDEEGRLTFAEWQALGLDRNSKMLPGRNGRPVGTWVFVFPNKYEKGRANVGIFNWDGRKSVEVDLSKALAKGRPYRVYNCLDIRQTLARARPVLEGTYDGGTVALPMRRDPASPDFDAFLVLPAD